MGQISRAFGLFKERMCSQLGAQPTSQEWVGLYKNVEDTMHEWVLCVGYLKEFSFGPAEFSAEFMGSFPKSIVGFQYFTFIEVKPNARKVVPSTTFLGWMSKVRVDRHSHGSAHLQFNL